MALIDLIESGSETSIQKVAADKTDLISKGESLFKVGENLALTHIKEAAEELSDEKADNEGKDPKSDMTSKERVAERSKEIFENLRKNKGKGKDKEEKDS